MQPRKRGILGVLITAGLFGGVATAGSMRELADWSALPGQIATHDVKFVMTDGSSLKARLVENTATDFVVFNGKQGQMTISHASVAEVHASVWHFSFVRRFSFRKFADVAFIQPLDMAIHANGFFSILPWDDGHTPVPLKIIDTLSIPFWLGWAAGGLAITPVVASIGHFRGNDHYDYRVQ
jgi:hypothetical protein